MASSERKSGKLLEESRRQLENIEALASILSEEGRRQLENLETLASIPGVSEERKRVLSDLADRTREIIETLAERPDVAEEERPEPNADLARRIDDAFASDSDAAEGEKRGNEKTEP